MVSGSLRSLRLWHYVLMGVLFGAVIAGVTWSQKSAGRDTGPNASFPPTMSLTTLSGTTVTLVGEQGPCLTNQFRGFYRMKDGRTVTFCWILNPQKRVILIDDEGEANDYDADEFSLDKSS